MFELLNDYYPAQATGFVVCDQDARVLATGEGVFELTGYKEEDLMGRDLVVRDESVAGRTVRVAYTPLEERGRPSALTAHRDSTLVRSDAMLAR